METDAPPSYREATGQGGPLGAAKTPTEDAKTVVSAATVVSTATVVDTATVAAKSRRIVLLRVAAVVLAMAGIASATAVALSLATGVLGTSSTPSNASLVVLTKYSGCDDLLSSLRASPGYNPSAYLQLSSRYQDGGMDWPVAELARAADASADDSGGAAGGGAGADSYSTTNVQVQGIDESDLVKNDGKHIFSVGGSQLVIVRAHPAEAKAVLSRTELKPEVRVRVRARARVGLTLTPTLTFTLTPTRGAPSRSSRRRRHCSRAACCSFSRRRR